MTIRPCVINLKISYRQLSMPKDLTLSKNNYLTIDMFKFTDVTASHVYSKNERKVAITS